jgi:AcrR family transcriptional regulator
MRQVVKMPQTTTPSTKPAVKRSRRTQERAEVTRAKLIEAGKLLFSERGFDGVLVRDLEDAAGVKRNILAYHFEDKDTLWKASADAIFGEMSSELDQRLEILKEISGREALAFIVRFNVYFHAKNPQLSRLMSQEATQHSWRIQYLIDNHIRRSALKMEKLVHETRGLDRKAFIHWYYIMISSTSTIFSFSAECEDLFGVDPCEESMVEAHAEMLVSMLLQAN